MDNLRIAKVDNVTLDRLLPPSSSSGTPTPQRQAGTLHLTPHHLIFSPSPQPSSSTSTTTQDNEEVWISYPSITLLSRLPQTFAGKYPLQIRTRGFKSYVLGFERAMEGGAEDVWSSVKDCAVATSVEQLYAFFYKLPPPISSGSAQTVSDGQTSSPISPSLHPAGPSVSNASSSGWATFNPRTEYARQGVGSRTKAWRFTDINKDYSYSPTYPAKMVVPSRISDSTLAYAGKYRSKARIPALTYLHWANQASITRSSQPMVGLKNARSAQDERLIECIFTSHLFLDTAYNATPPNPLSQSTSSPSVGPVYGATTTNLIIDARPTTNAMANVAIGAGTENMENYKMAKKAYLGIDNIHVMRNSLKTIQEAIRDSEPLPGQSVGMPLDKAILRKSNWLKHISTILDGSLIIIKNIHLNASHVLIHCSDGWDRTAQLSAVAQICLDPYYRTIDGFKVLVEKDWLAFGHKFLDRSGHLSSEKLFTVTDAPDDESDEELGGGGGGAQKAAQAFFASVQKQFNKSSDGHLKEISPVFHQFLDCVRQIQRQFPDRFEFNEEWLLDIHHHLYSCQFGTFLFNNERERRVAESSKGAYIDRTISAWEWFDRPEIRHKYVNENYKPELDDKESREPEADQGVLMYDSRDLKFWFRLFRRGDEEMNGPSRAITAQPGADMVIVPPGEVDPVSAEGVLDAIKAVPSGSGDKFVSGPGIDRGPSPRPPGAKALDGPSGKNTYRGIESTSSAFSLQTAGHPTPNPDSSSSLPSTGLPTNRNIRQTHTSTSGSGSGGSWGWTQFSSGAISALQRGVKEVRTIGEGAINQIRAEVGEYDGREMAGPGSGTGIGEGRPGGAVGRGVRLPSETNPWSAPSEVEQSPAPGIPRMTTDGYKTTAPTSHMRADGPITSLSRTDNQASTSAARPMGQKQPSWNTNPWGDDTSSTTSNIQSGPADNGPIREISTSDGLRHSLSDLKLVEEQRRTQSRVQVPGGETTKTKTRDEQGGKSDKELLDAAMGGDSRAWDPLGAA